MMEAVWMRVRPYNDLRWCQHSVVLREVCYQFTDPVGWRAWLAWARNPNYIGTWHWVHSTARNSSDTRSTTRNAVMNLRAYAPMWDPYLNTKRWSLIRSRRQLYLKSKAFKIASQRNLWFELSVLHMTWARRLMKENSILLRAFSLQKE